MSNRPDASVVEAGRLKFRVEWKKGFEHLRLPARKAWVGSAFLSIWLLLWAWGGSKAVISHYQDAMTPVWLVVLVLVLAGTTVLLMGQIVGVDIIRVHRGELTITRRAGPFLRTWRYSTHMIDNLRIDMSQWAGEDNDGAQYVPFTKQQWVPFVSTTALRRSIWLLMSTHLKHYKLLTGFGDACPFRHPADQYWSGCHLDRSAVERPLSSHLGYSANAQ